MKRVLLAAICVVPLAAQSQNQSQKKTESFWDKVLRIAGVSATPAALRGDDPVLNGDIWLVASAPGPAPQRLTRGGYHSPVFDSQGINVVALRGEDLYRIPTGGELPIKITSLPGVTKLNSWERAGTIRTNYWCSRKIVNALRSLPWFPRTVAR
jgi:hypothetical protein